MKRFIAEFEKQSFTQIIFPHSKSDWVEYLNEAESTFIEIINNIVKYQKCLIICDNISKVKSHFEKNENLFFIEYETDDTWARDCSAICIEEDSDIKLLDFTFTGWGGKFDSKKDNDMNKSIQKHYSKDFESIDFILEGGAVESNGKGVVLTTSECVLNKNRNNTFDSIQITQKLCENLGADTILYLNHGYLAGDDTDSHIDTLARFIDEKTIMYVKCEDENDEHFKELKLMEDELIDISKTYNFELISLPMTEPIYFNGDRLPATYANFLFVNGAILVPTYNVKEDEKAIKIFQETFNDRDIIPIDCSVLIRQHGSLHCVTMNFPSDVSICL